MCLKSKLLSIKYIYLSYDKLFLFKYDGLHLNPVESTRFSQLLNNQISDFRRKTSIQLHTESTTYVTLYLEKLTYTFFFLKKKFLFYFFTYAASKTNFQI